MTFVSTTATSATEVIERSGSSASTGSITAGGGIWAVPTPPPHFPPINIGPPWGAPPVPGSGIFGCLFGILIIGILIIHILIIHILVIHILIIQFLMFKIVSYRRFLCNLSSKFIRRLHKLPSPTCLLGDMGNGDYDDPSDASDPDSSSNEGVTDSSATKRSIAGRISVEELSKRSLDTRSNLGPCVLSIPIRVEPPRPQANQFDNFKVDKVIQYPKGDNKWYYQWQPDTTSPQCAVESLYLLQKRPSEKIPSPMKIGSINVGDIVRVKELWKDTVEHVYELKLLPYFFASVFNSHSTLCQRFKTVFERTDEGIPSPIEAKSPQRIGDTRLQSLFNLQPNNLNRAFVGAEQKINDMKGKLLLSDPEAFPPPKTGSTLEDSKMNFRKWNLMGMAIEFFNTPLVQTQFSVVNADIYAGLIAFNDIWNNDPSCHNAFDWAQAYRDWITQFLQDRQSDAIAHASSLTSSILQYQATSTLDGNGNLNSAGEAFSAVNAKYPPAGMTFNMGGLLSFPHSTGAIRKRQSTTGPGPLSTVAACSARSTGSSSSSTRSQSSSAGSLPTISATTSFNAPSSASAIGVVTSCKTQTTTTELPVVNCELECPTPQVVTTVIRSCVTVSNSISESQTRTESESGSSPSSTSGPSSACTISTDPCGDAFCSCGDVGDVMYLQHRGSGLTLSDLGRDAPAFSKRHCGAASFSILVATFSRELAENVSHMNKVMQEFFGQSYEDKAVFLRPDEERGYKEDSGDETFEIARDESRLDHLKLPKVFDQSRDVVLPFAERSNVVISTILASLSDGLGLQGENRFEYKHQEDQSSDSGLKVYSEPSKSSLSGVLDNSHTDGGTLTMLFYQHQCIQLENPGSKDWVWVSPKEDQPLINVADSLQRLSQGRFRSSVHKVTQERDGREQRYFISYFLRPSHRVGA
ncbi:MAG: hypothetical protein M1828_001187 [Chrysothrix sp. TS-e1954]|nr:MAG: hypothetical protein M1828_001187 [Chrysothrix sp. TS-e1954]